MGAGTYYAVGFGCREVPEMDDKIRSRWDKILDAHNIQTSYEGSSSYAVVELLCTMNDHNAIPSGVMPIGDLPDAIKKYIEKRLQAAKDTWATVRAAAVNIGLVLPEGELLWYADYD